MRHAWTPERLEVQKLDGPPPPWFDCGRSDQNEYLHQWAWADQQQLVSTTLLFSVDGLLAAYATLCMDALPLARDERAPEIRFRHIGAVKLAQLGVHRSFQNEGLGRHAVRFVVLLARDSNERIGCRYLTLDAQPDLVDWYARQGFLRNRLRQEERVQDAVTHRRDPEKIAVSMRFDLK